MIPRDTDLAAKQEKSSNNAIDDAKTTTTTTSWSRMKDPRIVRVSKAFGGKDRHSKVCTVRGLRDRRVRLSVPTAIQLYDLQERLGLNQPSKVVDWLLDAAKHEIDELPPLQIPQGIMLNSDHMTRQGGKFKDISSVETRNDHQSWTREDEEEERDEQYEVECSNQGNSFLSRQQQNPSSFSSLMSSSNSFERWDPSSLSLSSHAPIQQADLQSFSVVYHQSGMIAHPYFTPTNAAFDHQAARPIFNFNMALPPSHNNAGNQQSKRGDLHSS